MRRMIVVAAAAVVLGGGSTAQAAESDALGNWISGAGWKLFRGITNVAIGLPSEVITHAGGGVSGSHATTIGSTVTGVCSGIASGLAYGVVRMGSGIVDVATFPLPFAPVEDNRPLVEPEFKL